jgi:hypothetical protein
MIDDINKIKYQYTIKLSLVVVYHWRCTLETRSMLLWLTFFAMLFHSLNIEQSVCVAEEKKIERRMTCPVNWRDGKEIGHFTFSCHQQKETTSDFELWWNQTEKKRHKEKEKSQYYCCVVKIHQKIHRHKSVHDNTYILRSITCIYYMHM